MSNLETDKKLSWGYCLFVGVCTLIATQSIGLSLAVSFIILAPALTYYQGSIPVLRKKTYVLLSLLIGIVLIILKLGKLIP